MSTLRTLRHELLGAAVSANFSDAPRSLKDELVIALGELAKAERDGENVAVVMNRARAALRAWGEWEAKAHDTA